MSITPTQRIVADLAETLVNAVEGWWDAAGQGRLLVLTIALIEVNLGHSKDCLCDLTLAQLKKRLSGALPPESLQMAFDILRDTDRVYRLDPWDDAVGMTAVTNAAFRLGMLQATVNPGSTVIPALLGKGLVNIRHAPNQRSQERVREWYLKEGYRLGSKNKAAQKAVELGLSTVDAVQTRKWLYNI